jgi:hypothetical protein
MTTMARWLPLLAIACTGKVEEDDSQPTDDSNTPTDDTDDSATDDSATVTAAWLPDGLEWTAFDDALRARRLIVAGGQGKWAGQIIRFGHMGDVTWDEIDAALATTAEALNELGRRTDGTAARDAGRAAYESAAQAVAA